MKTRLINAFFYTAIPLSLACGIVLLSGCAFLSSHTVTPVVVNVNGTNVIAKATTDARAWTFFDANSVLAKFRNSNGGPTNTYTAGTVASGINESSSSSNIVQLLNDVAAIVSKSP